MKAAMRMVLIGTALLSVPAFADETEVHWTNIVRLSTLYQFNKVPPLAEEYGCSAGLNCGYGAAFTQGRADFLSDLSVARGGFDLHASLEARKDAVEPAASYIKPFEAYLHGTADLLGRPLTFSIGRQSVIWGESLYFAGNAIAGAQAPIDATVVDPSGYAATHFLPVGQASASWQLGDSLTLLAYQQFEWRRNRVDPEDAYASAGDVLGNDAVSHIALERIYGPVIYNKADIAQPSGTDQFGLGVKWQRHEWDLGLYGLQFDAKTPDLIYVRGSRDYALHYAQGVGLLGASLAGPLGDATISAEASARRHMPLVDGGIFLDPTDSVTEAGPRGNTLQGQISATLPIEPNRWLPGGASWTTELATNHLLAVTANPEHMAAGRSRDAAALRTVLTMQFYQVMPRLDLSVPIGIGWNIAGNSSVAPEMNQGSGDFSVGVSGTFDQSWTASLTATLYFGQDNIPIPGYAGHPMSEWNKVQASVQRSF